MFGIFKKKPSHIVEYHAEDGTVLFKVEGNAQDVAPYLANVGDEVDGVGDIYRGGMMFYLTDVTRVNRRISPYGTKTIITVDTPHRTPKPKN